MKNNGSQRQEEIAAAALDLLAEVPLESLTTRQIAQQLSISQPALFRHFRSRDELLVAAVELARRQLAQLAEQALRRPAEPAQRLCELLAAIIAGVEQHPGLPRLLFADGSAQSPELKRALRRVVSMQRNLLIELISELQESHGTALAQGPEQSATILLAALQGMVLQWRYGLLDRPLSEYIPTLITTVGLTATLTPQQVDQQRATSPPDLPELPHLSRLDVRPIIAGGDDPLHLILQTLQRMRQPAVLKLETPFAPKPLITLLQGRGYQTALEQLSGNHFCLAIASPHVKIDDLRDLPPPEPLVQVLEATTGLADRAVYFARVPRFPHLLLEQLAQRGLRHAVELEDDQSALIAIWRDEAKR